MERRLAAAVLVLSTALAGCASSLSDRTGLAANAPPAASGYPDLRDVPRTTDAQLNRRHWRGVAEELAEARAELLANPRAQYTPPEENPVEFLEEAREALAETRDSH